MKIQIAPSILSADFGRLTEQVQEAERGGADWIHVDVMDGRFVSTITIGPLVTEAVRRATTLPIDVHLMVSDPERHLAAFRDAGADVLTVHQEVCPHLHGTLQQIRNLGALAGVALNPSSPVSLLVDLIESIDLLLIMTVNPGFGGQAYIPSAGKVAAARRLLDEGGADQVHVQVDGGIGLDTAAEVVRAGADILVAGSAVYRNPTGVADAIESLRKVVRD